MSVVQEKSYETDYLEPPDEQRMHAEAPTFSEQRLEPIMTFRLTGSAGFAGRLVVTGARGVTMGWEGVRKVALYICLLCW